MRFDTAGELRRVDLTPVADILSALRGEWASLRFEGTGFATNPLTGEAVASFALVDGRHRQPGASYRVTVTSPKFDLPEGRRAEFDKEELELSNRNAEQAEWDGHFARRREASVQVGIDQHCVSIVLRADDARRLALTLSGEQKWWSVEVDLEHGRWPRVDLTTHLDLTAMWKADGSPGCFASFFGGPGRATASIDLGTLDQGGTTLEADGGSRKLRGSARLDVDASATRWAVRGVGTLRARGFSRIVLWAAGGRIRRGVARSCADFWESSEARTARLAADIERLRASITTEGGAGPFVRRALWDDTFDPGLDLLRSGGGSP